MRIVRARAGIEPEAHLIPTAGGQEEILDLFHSADAVLSEEKRRYATEQELADRVHDEYVARMKGAIRRDPTPYLDFDDSEAAADWSRLNDGSGNA
jgi:hypothetical protein